MTYKQPYLSGFATTFCGRAKRSLQDSIRLKRKSLRESTISTYALEFAPILPIEESWGSVL